MISRRIQLGVCLLTVFAGLVGFGVGGYLSLPGQAVAQSDDGESDTYQQLNLFGDAFNRVRNSYVEEVSSEELIKAAVEGMLSSLDPHSSYMDRKSYESMQVQTRGEFGGLGIEVTMENGLVRVVSPIDETPAFRAGVKPGDVVTHLDGEPVLGLNLEQAVDRMRGRAGTKLKLTIRRGEREPFDISITRDIIRLRSVRHRLFGNVGYVRITTFNDQTTSGLKSAVEDIREKLDPDFAGLVLDLRNNPGGLLDQAVSVSDAFLEEGEIVSIRRRDREDITRYNARRGDLLDGAPMVVLINGGSASASEIVAGAMQDRQRAVVVGTRSFGKGSVQTIVRLPSQGGAMRLTTARYYTPSGRSIQVKGVEPDIMVAVAKVEEIDESDKIRREENLRGALDKTDGKADGSDKKTDPDAVTSPDAGSTEGEDAIESDEKVTEKDTKGKDEAEAEEIIRKDYQLLRSVDILRGYALLRRRVAEAR